MEKQGRAPTEGSTPCSSNLASHVFKERYYGYECQKCGQFIAFGCEPWLDNDDSLVQYQDED